MADEFTGVLPEAGVRAFLDRVIPSPAAKAVAEAKARLAAKDVVGALAKLDEAHVLDPDGEDALLTRAEALVAHAEARLGVKLGGTTADGRITLVREEECLAGCCGAPMMVVDGHYREHLDIEKLDAILDGLE